MPNTYLLWKITSLKISENMKKKLEIPNPGRSGHWINLFCILIEYLLAALRTEIFRPSFFYWMCVANDISLANLTLYDVYFDNTSLGYSQIQCSNKLETTYTNSKTRWVKMNSKYLLHNVHEWVDSVDTPQK